MENVFIHPTAEVDKSAHIGENTKIWHGAQIREGAIIGKNCIIGKNAYIDKYVVIRDNVKIQNNSSIYSGTKLESGVFIGPHTVIINDKIPRAITPDGHLKTEHDWNAGRVLIREGASVGAHCTILTNVTIGKFALVGAGAVVSTNVEAYSLVVGTPNHFVNYICKCGYKLTGRNTCAICGTNLKLVLHEIFAQQDTDIITP